MQPRATILALVPALLLSAHVAAAQDSTPPRETAEEFESKLGYQTGTINLKDGLATLTLPSDFRFLATEGATRLLEEGWGNPPGSSEGVLGMIIPTEFSPLSDEGWGVIITFDEDGYVDDKGAMEIDYVKLLKEMQASTEETSAQRVKDGYGPIHLIGWAEPPSYNSATHKMYWAKELMFSDSGAHTLNYNVRVLGRRGVLVLNAVGNMGQLPTIKPAMQQVLGFVEFKDGHRYADYLPGKDKAATYGVAGLVAGAIATKAGFFKLLLAGLIAAKKLVIVGGVAVVAFFKRLMGRETTPKETPTSSG